jgi:signal transduction histidine kinase
MEQWDTARAVARLRTPEVADGLLAIALAAIHLGVALGVEPTLPGLEEFDGPTPVVVALTLLTTLPVAVRRRAPDVALTLVGLGMVAASALTVPSPGFGLIVVLYSYAAYTTKDDAAVVLAVFGGFTVLSLLLSGGIRFLPVNLVIFATAWVLGDRQRLQRLRTAALERRADALERERAVTAQLATARERTRIAEELHDVVAHGVTAMVTQAVGAQRLQPMDPARSRGALEACEHEGRASLTELRRLLGVLRTSQRPPSEGADTDPLHHEGADPAPRLQGGATAVRALQQRTTRWLSGAAGDLLLVLAILAVDLSIAVLVPADVIDLPGYEGLTAVGAVAVVLATLPLLWRRRAPLLVLAATTGLGLLVLAVPVASQQLAPLIALYTVAARCSRRVSLGCLAVLSGAVGVLWTVWEPIGPLGIQLVVLGTCWLLGDAQRARRARADAVAERTRALLADRERTAELAVVEERARIARELHDVVAHSIGLMVVQAGAARRVLDTDPLGAAGAITQVVETGRRTLTELRLILGVLRQDTTDTVYEPQPGLAALPDLIERLAATSLHVVVRVEGTPSELPSGIDLSAYRIIQESLTNVLRHADANSAEVTLTWAPDALSITIADDGRGPLVGVASEGGGGHGLLGMRERAGLVGGTLAATSRPGGGFLVTATLPMED